MFRKIRAVVISLIIVFFVVGLSGVQAQETAKKFVGKVQDVDLDEKSVVIGSPKGDIVVYMESHAQIKKGKTLKSLSDLKVGTMVEVTYKTVAEDKIVESIEIVQ